MPKQLGGGYSSWTVGQPLGLYPSFASFALAHHSVVRGIHLQLGKDKFRYRLLGDDIVIWDDEVAHAYRKLMTSLGVAISEAKSLVSASSCEFAGALITCDDVLYAPKFKPWNDNSFMELFRVYGYKRALSLMTKRQKRVAEFLAMMPYPVGVDANPLGLPWKERWELWELLQRDPQSRAPRVNVGVTGVVRRFYETIELGLPTLNPDIEQMSDVGLSDALLADEKLEVARLMTMAHDKMSCGLPLSVEERSFLNSVKRYQLPNPSPFSKSYLESWESRLFPSSPTTR